MVARISYCAEMLQSQLTRRAILFSFAVFFDWNMVFGDNNGEICWGWRTSELTISSWNWGGHVWGNAFQDKELPFSGWIYGPYQILGELDQEICRVSKIWCLIRGSHQIVGIETNISDCLEIFLWERKIPRFEGNDYSENSLAISS